jgi:hypothetical protein
MNPWTFEFGEDLTGERGQAGKVVGRSEFLLPNRHVRRSYQLESRDPVWQELTRVWVHERELRRP